VIIKSVDGIYLKQQGILTWSSFILFSCIRLRWLLRQIAVKLVMQRLEK